VQRGQHEDQRERIRGDDEQRDDAERQQRGGVPCELLLGGNGAAREQAVPRDEPAGEREQPECGQ
jgi:hypothetical protein